MLLKDAIDEFERGLVGQAYSKNSVATYKRHLHERAPGRRIGELIQAEFRRRQRPLVARP